MESEFWHARWSEGRIGFHEARPNRHLLAHGSVFDSTKRILVPLCGKSEDLAFLAAQGHEVVGVEWVEAAVRAFFEEHALTPMVTSHGALTRFACERITLWAGDFLATTEALLGPLDAVYDRAALIALPEQMRARYVPHLRRLLGHPKGLVVTVEYDQTRMEGPPFSVSEGELRSLWSKVPLVCVGESPADGARLPEIGAIERCWSLG